MTAFRPPGDPPAWRQVHWNTEWSDGREPTLEDALSQILQELGLRSAAAEAKRKADEEAAVQKRRRWEAAMVQAWLAYEEAAKANALHRQIEDWQKAEQVRRFLGFAREAVGCMPTETERVAALQWLEWIAVYADRLDPLAQLLRMPDLLEPHSKDLDPHLNVCNAYGP